MLTVPFENLDIHLKRPIMLDESLLYDKIVRNRRGGFCYELNGLFCSLLRALGFDAAMLSAGVARPDGSFGPDFDHMTLVVNCGQKWLADVGFGDSFVEPLQLDSPGEQIERGSAYRIDADGLSRTLMRRVREGPWEPQYRFTLQSRVLAEFRGMCAYHQTSPDSTFTHKRVVTRATADGRITLSEMRRITTASDGSRKEEPLAGFAEYDRALLDLFGIRLP
jgi:N-hydroxyarylamine O-acetyltransferase